MLNENAKEWVAALRSGEFQQTQGELGNRDGYCCLGVACEVYRRHLDLPVSEHANATGTKLYGTDQFVLPRPVMIWLGLQSGTGRFNQFAGKTDTSLADLNDKGATFTEIADAIESEPAGLFETH